MSHTVHRAKKKGINYHGMHQKDTDIHLRAVSHMFRDDIWIFSTQYSHIVPLHLFGDVESSLICKPHANEVLIHCRHGSNESSRYQKQHEGGGYLTIKSAQSGDYKHESAVTCVKCFALWTCEFRIHVTYNL